MRDGCMHASPRLPDHAEQGLHAAVNVVGAVLHLLMAQPRDVLQPAWAQAGQVGQRNNARSGTS